MTKESTDDELLRRLRDVDEVMAAGENNEEPAVTAAEAWEEDPSTSYSDWTIRVSSSKTKDETTKETYHVHKVHLALGSCKCAFFVGQFSFAASRDDLESVSKVELRSEAAKMFPTFLNYVYSNGKSYERLFNSSFYWLDLFALHFLGNYFGCEPLCKDTLKTIKQHLSAEKVARLCAHIFNFPTPELLKLTQVRLLQRLQSDGYNLDPDDWHSVKDVVFFDELCQCWLEIGRSREPWLQQQSFSLDAEVSKAVADFVNEHRSMVTGEQFLEWTSSARLREISGYAVEKLLDLKQHYFPAHDENNKGLLECLERRCLAALRDPSPHLDEEDIDRILTTYKLNRPDDKSVTATAAMTDTDSISEAARGDHDDEDGKKAPSHKTACDFAIRVFGSMRPAVNGLYVRDTTKKRKYDDPNDIVFVNTKVSTYDSMPWCRLVRHRAEFEIFNRTKWRLTYMNSEEFVHEVLSTSVDSSVPPVTGWELTNPNRGNDEDDSAPPIMVLERNLPEIAATSEPLAGARAG